MIKNVTMLHFYQNLVIEAFRIIYNFPAENKYWYIDLVEISKKKKLHFYHFIAKKHFCNFQNVHTPASYFLICPSIS